MLSSNFTINLFFLFFFNFIWGDIDNFHNMKLLHVTSLNYIEKIKNYRHPTHFKWFLFFAQFYALWNFTDASIHRFFIFLFSFFFFIKKLKMNRKVLQTNSNNYKKFGFVSFPFRYFVHVHTLCVYYFCYFCSTLFISCYANTERLTFRSDFNSIALSWIIIIN